MKPQTLKGFRDFDAEDLKIRYQVIDTLKEVFSSFGFEPLETPALEYAETLLGKYGEEANKLIYNFPDRGGRQVGLRYDLTVPLARYISQNANTLTFPYKRYQIQPVWRAENPQKGRFREFYQGDVDIVGTSSPLADAEIVAVAYEVFSKLGFPNFKILLSRRDLLYSIMEEAQVPSQKRNAVAISLDKQDKIDQKGVEEELVEKKGVTKGCVDELFRVTSKLEDMFPDGKSLVEGDTLKIPFNLVRNLVTPLKEVARYATKMGVPPEVLVPKFTLARGLDYYTGPIFEVVVEDPKIGSLAGGGRYDQLIKQLGGPDLPATGIAFGLERIVDVAKELKLPLTQTAPKIKSLICPIGNTAVSPALELANKLRGEAKKVEVYLDPETKLEKQLKYADRKGFTYAIIMGEREVATKMITLKNLKTGEQKNLSVDECVKSCR